MAASEDDLQKQFEELAARQAREMEEMKAKIEAQKAKTKAAEKATAQAAEEATTQPASASPMSKMTASVSTQQGFTKFNPQGIRLKPGDVILLDISELFTKRDESRQLAVRLLAGTRYGGGEAFLNNIAGEGTSLGIGTTAFKVLVEWCHVKPQEAMGGRLLEVLQKVCSAAAKEFAEELVPGITEFRRNCVQETGDPPTLDDARSAPVRLPVKVETEKNCWKEVVRPMYERVVEVISHDPAEVARACFEKNLISESDLKYVTSNYDINDEQRTDRLLQTLFTTGNDGYFKFKEFLAKFSHPNRYARLLVDMETTERSILMTV